MVTGLFTIKRCVARGFWIFVKDFNNLLCNYPHGVDKHVDNLLLFARVILLYHLTMAKTVGVLCHSKIQKEEHPWIRHRIYGIVLYPL